MQSPLCNTGAVFAGGHSESALMACLSVPDDQDSFQRQIQPSAGIKCTEERDHPVEVAVTHRDPEKADIMQA